MTLIQAIKLAQEQGHIIEYVKRKDGGVRVTKVNGKSFSSSSSSGNTAVRSLTGTKLSVKQTASLKKNRKTIKSKEISKKLKKEFNKANKQRAKVGLKKVKKTKLIEVKKKRGKVSAEDMIKRMKNSVRYKMDFAYTQNIAGFVSQLEDAFTTPNKVNETYDFSKLIDLIESNLNYISETALQSGIAILYLWNGGEISGETAEGQIIVEFKLEIDRMKEVEQMQLEE